MEEKRLSQPLVDVSCVRPSELCTIADYKRQAAVGMGTECRSTKQADSQGSPEKQNLYELSVYLPTYLAIN